MNTFYTPKVGHYVAHRETEQHMIVVSQNLADNTWYCVWTENGARQEGYFKAADLILVFPPVDTRDKN